MTPSSLHTAQSFVPQRSGVGWRLRPQATAVVIAMLSAILLCGVIAFYDNTNRATTNGLWKSIQVVPWVEGAPDRKTEDSNLLYYPAVGALVRMLPESLGPVWRRMAFVNAIFAAAVLALTYLIALRLFSSPSAALFACVSHAVAAFFLLLSTINEDIMPGYAWFVAATACAILPRRLRAWTLALAAQCVALSWLFHSSLQLPGIGALLAGILAVDRDLRRGVRQAAWFCACLIPLPVIAALSMGVDASAGLWSGKGLGSGWGGFSLNKLAFMWSGIAQYVAGGQNIVSVGDVVSPRTVAWNGVAWTVIACVAYVWIAQCRRLRGRPEWRIAAAILGTAFLLGEAMNLYVQPQDPQMQLQPMTWFPFAAGAAFWSADRWTRSSRAKVALQSAMAAAALLLLTVNILAYTDVRDGDSMALRNVRELEAVADPSRTVFLVHGFEGMTTWLTATWGRGAVWPNREAPEPVPPLPRFNAIVIASEGTEFPQRSAADAADDIVRLVDRALSQGFDVVATDIFAASEEQWVSSFDSISGPDKPRAIRDALQDKFEGTRIGSLPGWGNFYRVSRKPR